MVVAGVAINISTSCDGFCEWGFSFPSRGDDRMVVGGDTFIDGVRTLSAVSPLGSGTSRFRAIDHVVVNTDDLLRTSNAVEVALGAPVRNIRDAGRGVSQAFHLLDNTVIEVVSGPHIDQAGASLWGFVVVVEDIFEFATMMGPDVLSAPKKAVQPGRYIASVRPEAALGVPVAFMSPRVRGFDEG